MKKAVHLLIALALMLRIFTGDAMALSMASHAHTATTHTATAQAHSAIMSADCEHAMNHGDSGAPTKKMGQAVEHAQCFDCCVGAFVHSSQAMKFVALSCVHTPAANLAFSSAELRKVAKPPVF